MLVVLSGAPLHQAAHAQSSPSVALGLSPSDSVEEGTEIAVTMSFGGLSDDDDRATTDYVFRADVLDADDGDADACEGGGLGRDRYMYQVDEDPETRAATISVDCPVGKYNLRVSIFDAGRVELASARAPFSVNEPPRVAKQNDGSQMTVKTAARSATIFGYDAADTRYPGSSWTNNTFSADGTEYTFPEIYRTTSTLFVYLDPHPSAADAAGWTLHIGSYDFAFSGASRQSHRFQCFLSDRAAVFTNAFRAAFVNDATFAMRMETGATPTVTISAGAATADEGDALDFTVTRAAVTADALTVTVDVSETGDLVPGAAEGSGPVTILANEASATLRLDTDPDDDTWEEHSHGHGHAATRRRVRPGRRYLPPPPRCGTTTSRRPRRSCRSPPTRWRRTPAR